MRRPALASLLGLSTLLGPGCVVTPDPCAGHPLACLAVTVESGPPAIYQLLVSVDTYSSTTPLTPRRRPEAPLVYPLRFAVRFGEFDRRHTGHVTLDVRALDGENEVRGQARVTVPIDNMEKRRLSLVLGEPLDRTEPEDLVPAPDLTADHVLPDPTDGGLADGGAPG